MSKKTKISEKDRVELERAKNDFEAVKRAKRTIQIKKQRSDMTKELTTEGGVARIKVKVEVVMDELDKAARKQEEFPEDEQANIEVEIAEAKIDAVADAAEEIVDAREVGLSERPKMKEIIRKAQERRAYNSMWKEAKTLFLRGSKEELTTLFYTVQMWFKEKEEEYNVAVAKNRKDPTYSIKVFAKNFDKALTQYNASLTIRFDLDELKEKLENKLDIQISDKQKAEIKETVEYLRKSKAQLIKMMKYKYEEFMRRAKAVEKKPDDQEVAKAAALAESEYVTYKVNYEKIEVEE
jgi:hypothetical protein